MEWLRDVNPEIEKGVYELSPRVKAVVSDYTTKEVNENGYEAHRDYIDIQYLLSGNEVIYCLPLDYIKEIKAYNSEIDASFYVESGEKPQELLLGNGFFCCLLPAGWSYASGVFQVTRTSKKIVIKIMM